MQQTYQRGFTLIQRLVVLAIVGVIASVAASYYLNHHTDNTKVQDTVNDTRV